MYNTKDNVHTNVTWKRFRVTIVPVEEQYVFYILSVCL